MARRQAGSVHRWHRRRAQRLGEAFGHERLDDIVGWVPAGERRSRCCSGAVHRPPRRGRATTTSPWWRSPWCRRTSPCAEPGPRGRARGSARTGALPTNSGPRSLRRGSPLPLLQQMLVEFPASAPPRRHDLHGALRAVLQRAGTRPARARLVAEVLVRRFHRVLPGPCPGPGLTEGFVRFACRCEIDEADGVSVAIAVTTAARGSIIALECAGGGRGLSRPRTGAVAQLCSEVRLHWAAATRWRCCSRWDA
jgi:hypothetical protein